MGVSSKTLQLLAIIFLTSCIVAVALPLRAHALGQQADDMCTTVIPTCPCMTVPSSQGCVRGYNQYLCPDVCWDNTHGFVTLGTCVAPRKCLAVSTSDDTFDVDLGLLNQALQAVQLGVQLFQLGGPAGQNSGQASGQTPGADYYGTPYGAEGCYGGYYQTSDVSRLSDPCAEYVPDIPSVSSGIDTGAYGAPAGCDAISQLLGTCEGTNTNTNTNISTNINTSTNLGTTSAAVPPAPRRTIFQPNLGGLTGPTAGLRGDILTRFRDATILAGSRDLESNVEVAGFFGSETFGTQQPQSLVARWCQSRPWASNFLSKIVTPSFFDNICTSRGYSVGVAASTPQVTRTQPPAPRTTSTPVATSTPRVPPKVDIWASPPSVSLGGRTSIFWNAEGVESCIETASDGNFNQRSLSGGAATVPITEATTFTITCLVSDGSNITASTVVGLKI
ncbi:hypothetical protein COU18_00180 [Candidatus Kaiserbacteria bacterium CG10_big_fil_rev_8_21_14_0_10_51_14]|uniref:Uncharacterized protein n=1 Tax=Candidatus Kaiserbacteria bacterium CG10_big_fil_rev_8_21_14_0_10_51_14 TaxID=1974610 RepID=A0A2H0UCS3_9BACT|nr:MAG: hypothetical protein COU18_00180 [Candidatus Kaiserbacteria bacterium CG10_big_fil_rev_8_21_14_0_10_51_14]